MFLLAFALFLLVEALPADSKFYETDYNPLGARYSTYEYTPEGSYPYGQSYKRYPDIPYYPAPLGSYPGGSLGGVPGAGYGYAPGGAPGHYGYPGGSPSIGYGYAPGGHYGGLPTAGYGYPLGGYPHALGGLKPGFYGHQVPYGAAQINAGVYGDNRRNLLGEEVHQVRGLNGESLNHGDVGFNKAEVNYKDAKGDSVHFIDADGVNRGRHEGKSFSGGHQFDSEGKQAAERVLNANHNKGHNVKGFKKSHHLDETGKTEEFFDQDRDAGGNYAFDGRFGKFGEAGGEAYKGGFNDGRFKSGEATKQGHYDNQYFQDNARGGSGKFGGNKYAQNDNLYELNKGYGEHGLNGYHENNNYYKNSPVGYGGYY